MYQLHLLKKVSSALNIATSETCLTTLEPCLGHTAVGYKVQRGVTRSCNYNAIADKVLSLLRFSVVPSVCALPVSLIAKGSASQRGNAKTINLTNQIMANLV